jgi:hypothetical protein
VTEREHFCDQLKYAVEADDLPVVYVPELRQYGIQYTDGGTSYQVIAYCPWDGTKLPEPLGDEWFRLVIDELGLDPEDPRVPEEMRSDRWWKDAGL